MKLGWILSMLILICPKIFDWKTKTSLKDVVACDTKDQLLRFRILP